MPRKQTRAIVPSQIELQQAKVAEKAAKKARRKLIEESREEVQLKLTELIKKKLPDIEKDLDAMTPKQRCDTIAALAPYVLPKMMQTPAITEETEAETDELSELAETKATNELKN